MVIRELEPQEWARLAELPGLDGGFLPAPGTAGAIVAENEDGQIVAYWVIQLQACAEPVWIAPEHRGGMLLGRMFRAVQDALRRVAVKHFLVHGDEHSAGYVERLGLRKQPWHTFQGEVN